MRALITRSFLLLFATAMIALVIADNLKTAGANALKVNSHKPKSSTLKEGATPAIADIAEPNPLLAQWEGPYGGVPPFDRVQVSFFKPALEAAMSENLADVETQGDLILKGFSRPVKAFSIRGLSSRP